MEPQARDRISELVASEALTTTSLDDYPRYAGHIEKALGDLQSHYGSAGDEISEAQSMAIYSKKIIETLRALDIRFRFGPTYLGRPSIATSGFPLFSDVTDLDKDLAVKELRLPKLADITSQRALLLDSLMTPSSVLDETDKLRLEERRNGLKWQIAERLYLESLDLRRQFFAYTPGKLIPVEPGQWAAGEKERRYYLFSWGCWDQNTNRPYVYFMLFAQLEKEVPLDAPGNPEYSRFNQTIGYLAARAPERLDVIGVRLDETFKTLFPKVIKRFSIGPIISPLIYRGVPDSQKPDIVKKLLELFREAALSEDDYILFFRTQFLISQGEATPATPLSLPFLGTRKVRQLFRIPKTDLEAMQEGVSSPSQPYALMPHRLRQHLDPELQARFPELAKAEFMVYQPDGVINVG